MLKHYLLILRTETEFATLVKLLGTVMLKSFINSIYLIHLLLSYNLIRSPTLHISNCNIIITLLRLILF